MTPPDDPVLPALTGRRALAVLFEAMVEQARQHAAESGVIESLSLDVGDVYALTFEDSSFVLVIAIGVIPWLARPELAMQEMARVTRAGGHVILTADNGYDRAVQAHHTREYVPVAQNFGATFVYESAKCGEHEEDSRSARRDAGRSS